MKNFFFLIAAFAFHVVKPQANFTAGVYSQNFGTTAVGAGAFVDNSTFPGWYLDNVAFFVGTINITAAAPINTGGQYMYTCGGGTDMKLGTRPSNGSGGGPCDLTPNTCGHGLGLRLSNNTGALIQSIKVDFDWFQFSLAQNGNTVNSILFYYQTGVGPLTNVNGVATGGTNVPGLNFTALQSSAACCSSQISGYPCNQTGHNSACIPVNIPINNEIMLVWWDPNNSNNDPHFGIDNVSVTTYSDNACVTILPIELLDFKAIMKGESLAEISFTTLSEQNVKEFTVSKSYDGFNFSLLANKVPTNTNEKKTYLINDFVDNSKGVIYYRLEELDNNGALRSVALSYLELKPDNNIIIVLKEENITIQSSIPVKSIELFSPDGKKILTYQEIVDSYPIDLTKFPKGLYLLKIIDVKDKITFKKLIF